jgi:cobalt-zinc-cadmium efflux system outer membrane protein
MWDAYGNLLPQIALSTALQKSDEGSFVIAGSEFRSPETFSTTYQVDFTHSLLDSGRDWLRIKGARANVDRAIAAYDAQSLETKIEIKTQYLAARRAQTQVEQAKREIESRQRNLERATGRYNVGEVTKSDVLQARLNLTRAEVGLLEASQDLEESLLALRNELGGELPPSPVRLSSQFEVFDTAFDVDDLVDQAIAIHPRLKEIRAQESVDESSLWIARSSYLPSLSFRYSLSRSVTDTIEFQFDSFDERNFYTVALSWPLFGRFSRYNETSRANASLQTTRAAGVERSLNVEQGVRTAFSRLETARATHSANAVALELAREDLSLWETRYEVGEGAFVDLFDAQVRATRAETDFIASTFDFFLALAQLERATGLNLFPVDSP